MKYKFTDNMREISGMGGGYEECCRKMVAAGLEWFDEHLNADPRFHGYKNIHGVIMEDNDDARALSRAVIHAAEGEATGAMLQATISHILKVREIGWLAYCKIMRKLKREEQTK